MQKNTYQDLELEEDIIYERKNWVAERVAWVALLLFVLAALAGFLGGGGVSNAKAGSVSEGLEIEYQKYLRYHTPDQLVIYAHNAPKNGTYSIVLNKEWLDKVEIERILPQPETEKATGTGTEFIFNIAPGQSPLTFTFSIKPNRVGTAEVSITGSGNSSVSVSQFIYP